MKGSELKRPYCLAPDGPAAKEAFAVVREGVTGKAGIGKVALSGREYLIKVQPYGREIVTQELEAPAKVVNLMEALRKSLDSISAANKKSKPRGAPSSKRRTA